jgi:hypothetical protein
MTTTFRFGALVLTVAAILGAASLVEASHSWGSYHWARTSNPFTLKLADNVSGPWDAVLATASQDWNADPSVLYPGSGIQKVLSTTIVPGTAGKNCKATSGMVQVCNSKYGNNGWLGIAQIWASGSHITAGVVKLNDTYFNTPTYNTVAWRNLVTCQEVGHTFGLDHQDEGFDNPNLNTCMDYTNSPLTNQHPNLHDFEQLASIYGHLDTTTTVKQTTTSAAGAEEVSGNSEDWGKEIKRSKDGRSSVFEKNLPDGKKVVTHVFWVESRGKSHAE